MTTPTLALGITAGGAQAVADLANSVGKLTSNLQQLKAVAGNASTQGFSGLQALSDQMRGMRQELNESLAAINTSLVEGFQKLAGKVRQGADAVEAEGKQGAVRIRAAIKGISFGGDLSMSASGSGTGIVDQLRKVQQDLKTNTAAVAAQAEADALILEKAVARVMKSATMPGYLNAGPAWWDAMLAEQERGLAKLEAEYAKEIATLEKLTASAMRAATVPGYLPAGPAWWDKVIAQQEQAQAALAAQNAKEEALLRKQVSGLMQAATVAGYRPAGVAWWEKVIAEQEKGAQAILDDRLRIMGRLAQAQMNQQIQGAVKIGEGSYSAISGSNIGVIRNVSDDIERLGGKSAEAKAKVTSLAGAMEDAHSAARGLASGFNAMWLTWGNLGPLLAGAAVSGTFVQALKIGAQVQDEFETIRVLSQETVGSMNMLQQTLLDLGRSGPFGPLEIAKAMKTLSLAGLNAAEVNSSIKDVLDFSVAGTTSIEKAADVLTTVGVAFKISANDYSYIGDVISKAAAVSKSSVEGMGEAFKTASTVNSLYGVSLKDVGTNLALLSNVGIQNSNAGTALTNMYIDLAGRTPKATKALKELGVEAIDPLNGKMKDLAVIYRDLLTKLAEKTPVTQLEYINSIFAQRSRKDVVAIVDAMRTAAKEGGVSVKTEFDRIANEIANSAGFQGQAAAAMMLTPMNQMKSVVASLKTSFVESFSEMEPAVLSVSMKLKQTFESPSFQEALNKTVTGIASIIEIVANNLGVLMAFGTALAAWKIGSSIAAMFTLMSERLLIMARATSTATAETTKLAAAQEAQAAAQTTAAATGGAALLTNAAGLLSVFSKIVPWIGLAVTGWQLYSIWTAKAGDATDQLHGSSFEAMLDALKREADHLEKVNEAKAKGVALDDLERASAIDRIRASNENTLNQQRSLVFTLEGRVQNSTSNPNKGVHANLQKALTNARSELERMEQEFSGQDTQLQAQLDRITAAQVARAKRVEADAKALKDSLKSGTGTRPEDGTSINASRYAQELRQINGIIDAQRDLAKAADESSKAQEKALTQSYQVGAISYETYQNKLNDVATSHYEERKRILDDEVAKTTAQLAILQARAKALDPKKSQTDERLSNDIASAKKRLTEDTTALVKVANDEYARQVQLQVDALKPSADLLNNAQAQEATIQQNFKQELERLAIKKDTLEVSQREQFVQQEILKATNAQADMLAKAEQILKGNLAKGLYDDLSDPKVLNNFNNLLALIDQLKSQLQQMKEQAGQSAGAFYDNKAIDDARKKNEQAWTRDEKKIEDGIYNAIANGGASGFKKLIQDAKSWFARLVLQPIIQPIAAFGASIMNPGATVGTAASGASGLASLGNMAGLAGSLSTFGGGLSAGFGGVTGSIGSMLGMAGTGTTISGALDAGFTALSMGNIAGGLGTLAGVAGPFALGAMVVLSMLKKGGGPKVDSQYNPLGGYMGVGNSTDQLSTPAAKTAAQTIQSQYDQMIRGFGGTTGMQFGVGISTDPKGDAPTMLQMQAGIGSAQVETVDKNVGRSDQELQDAITKMSTDILLKALKASNMSQPFKDYFNSISETADVASKQAAIKVGQDVAAYDVQTRNLGGVFERLSNQSVKLRGDLIQAAGGLQSLSSATASYFNNFYSLNERNAITQKSIEQTLNGVGLSIKGIDLTSENARAQFRAMVDAIDETTAAGRQQFTTLMGVADAFASLTQSMDPAKLKTAADIAQERVGLEQQLNQLLGRTAELRKAELATLDETNRALQERIYAITDAQSGTDMALASLDRMVDAEKAAIQLRMDALNKEITTLKSLDDYLKQQVNELYNQATPLQTAAAGRGFVSNALDVAQKTGVLPDQTLLSDAVTAIRNVSDNNYSSAFEAARDKLVLAGQLHQLQTISGKQLTDAQQQLADLQKQIDHLDAIKQYAHDQVDVLRGTIDPSIRSVEEAVNKLADALLREAALKGKMLSSNTEQVIGTPVGNLWQSSAGAFGFQKPGGGWSVTDTTGASYGIDQAQSFVNSRLAAGDPMSVYTEAKARGISGNSLDAIMMWTPGTSSSWAQANGLPAFADGGWHQGGWAMVGERGPELAYMPPARIYNTPQTMHMTNASDDQVRMLREELRAQAAASVRLNTRLTKVFEKWDKDGMPETRVV